jgi:hypothetical protein
VRIAYLRQWYEDACVSVDIESSILTFLTSALRRGEWSASRPGRFSSVERAPTIHWMGPRAGLDVAVKADKLKTSFLLKPGLDLCFIMSPCT